MLEVAFCLHLFIWVFLFGGRGVDIIDSKMKYEGYYILSGISFL